MDLLIVGIIVAAAFFFTFRYLLRMFRGKRDCAGCRSRSACAGAPVFAPPPLSSGQKCNTVSEKTEDSKKGAP